MNVDDKKRPKAVELLKNPLFKGKEVPIGSFEEGDFKMVPLNPLQQQSLDEWLEDDVRKKLGYSYITPLLAEDLVERLNGISPISRDLVQASAIACFSLASKLVEPNEASLDVYSSYCHDSCRKNIVIALQISIFKQLEFLLYTDNLVSYCNKDQILAYKWPHYYSRSL